MVHPYIPNSRETRDQMLREMGLSDVEELFKDIPPELRIKRGLDLPPAMPELAVVNHVKSVLSKNLPFTKMPSFLGGGVWPHYVPAHVRQIVKRAEFLTSYTPYQPETSQGMLQALFEFQSLVAELVGLEVANASMYDWATSLGEAALMSARVTGRSKFILPKIISKDRLSVLENYAAGPSLELVEVDYDRETGQVDLDQLARKVDDNTAGVYIENPSYLGFLETQVDEIAELAHSKGALFVVGVNPISLGLLRAPGDYGADIVIGEGQPLGNPVSFGGPTLGIFACRGEQRLLRQLPGRLIGMTKTVDGKDRGFCMVLQTREQHIRREKATSNICSNEALCAVAAAVYLATLGPRGLRELAEVCAANASYLMKQLSQIEGIKVPLFKSPHFNEFTMQCTRGSISWLNAELLKRGFHGGKPLRREFPELGEAALLCTTELHTKENLDGFVEAVRKVMEG
ncbi:MAG: glycine dehydrogenase [Candidatus Hadarchaeum yellowstonense]|uniref:Probable glycine dehydrogenase (decarboxylating) subunit 1 n=1 Tax=Hadarchaeum yellowstonense TaxID=1776334 RepID=A0A147K1A5_HADYE|nr:MAG: glycine dehydrogenase [Candidatus Hadarchaeum yellowstonense]